MPLVNTAEWVFLLLAFVLFSVVPAVLAWADALRLRRAEAAARAAARAAALPPMVVPEEEADAPIADAPPPAREIEPGAAPAVDAAEEAQAAGEPAVVEPAAGAPPAAAYEFCLDDLRRARALETAPADVVADPARRQEWEDGLRLAEAHAAAIGAVPLSAPFEPQARSFAGMRAVAETKELRFLLFPTLWPTSADQAAGQALYRLDSGGIAGARVSSVG
jgi:hypothetical protein